MTWAQRGSAARAVIFVVGFNVFLFGGHVVGLSWLGGLAMGGALAFWTSPDPKPTRRPAKQGSTDAN